MDVVHSNDIKAYAPPEPHDQSMICPLCDIGPDGFLHLFGHYSFIRIAWRDSKWNVANGFPQNWNGSTMSLIDFIYHPPGFTMDKYEHSSFSLSGSVLWYYIWSERDAILYVNK